MALSDGQNSAITNGEADKAAIGTTGATAVPVGSNVVSTPTFVTATALQLNAKTPVDLYLNITTAAALTIAMGPTSAAATVLNASESDALGLIHIYVPAGWYVKLTGTMANITPTVVTH